MGRGDLILLTLPLVTVFLHLCSGVPSHLHSSKRRVCYDRDLIQDKGEFRVFGVLSKKSDLQIEEVFPFNSALLPRDPRELVSTPALEMYLRSNGDLLKRQCDFVNNQPLATIHSKRVPFYRTSDMLNTRPSPAVELELGCEVITSGKCPGSVECTIEIKEKDKEVKKTTFTIKRKAKRCKIYLQKLFTGTDVKYEDTFMYVAFGTISFSKDLHDCSMTVPKDSRSPLIAKCTRDASCHSAILQSARSYLDDFTEKCDHAAGRCGISGNMYGECWFLSTSVFYKILEVYFNRGKLNSWATASEVTGPEVFEFLKGKDGIQEVYEDIFDMSSKGPGRDSDSSVNILGVNEGKFFGFMEYLREISFDWTADLMEDRTTYHAKDDLETCYSLGMILERLKSHYTQNVKSKCGQNMMKAMIIGVGFPCMTSVDEEPTSSSPQSPLPSRAVASISEDFEVDFYSNHFILLVEFPDGSVIGFNSADVGLILYKSFDEFWDVHSAPRFYEETFQPELNDKFLFASSFVVKGWRDVLSNFLDEGADVNDLMELKHDYLTYKREVTRRLQKFREVFTKLHEKAFYGFQYDKDDTQGFEPRSRRSIIQSFCNDFRTWSKTSSVSKEPLPYTLE